MKKLVKTGLIGLFCLGVFVSVNNKNLILKKDFRLGDIMQFTNANAEIIVGDYCYKISYNICYEEHDPYWVLFGERY